jgi:protein TonB
MSTIKNNWKQALAVCLIGGSVLVACQDSRDYKAINEEPPSGDATTMDSTREMPVDQSVTSKDNTSDRPATTDMGPNASTNPNASTTVKKREVKRRASINMARMNGNSSTMAVRDADGIYSRAEIMPVFPGGQDALQKFVEDNVEYPEQAIQDGTEGDIRLVFTVNETGKVTNVRAVGDNNTEYEMKEQAVTMMNKMPTWTPGTVNGKKVKTRMTLPINFQIIE